MSSQYTKSVHSPRSSRDSSVESWGTVHSDSRKPTPAASPCVQSPTYSHRSSASYPSPCYGPSSPLGVSPAPYSPTSQTSQTPGAPYVFSVPLPQQYTYTPAPTPLLSNIPLPGDSSINPLLSYPPQAVFNVTYPRNCIAFRGGLSSNDVAVYPPVQFIVLGFSAILSGKTIDVRASSPRGLTVHDVFVTLSKFLLSTPSSSDMAALGAEAIARAKAQRDTIQKVDGDPHMKWSDLLGHRIYFGGLVKTGNVTYEVGFVSAPLT